MLAIEFCKKEIIKLREGSKVNNKPEETKKLIDTYLTIIRCLENTSNQLPFETHSIYVTLDDNITYKVNRDFSKTEFNEIPAKSIYCIMHKLQFDACKNKLMDVSLPEQLRLTTNKAVLYNQLGFITDHELFTYIHNCI